MITSYSFDKEIYVDNLIRYKEVYVDNLKISNYKDVDNLKIPTYDYQLLF